MLVGLQRKITNTYYTDYALSRYMETQCFLIQNKSLFFSFKENIYINNVLKEYHIFSNSLFQNYDLLSILFEYIYLEKSIYMEVSRPFEKFSHMKMFFLSISPKVFKSILRNMHILQNWCQLKWKKLSAYFGTSRV